MAVAKVILNGTTLMDVTQDTVAADKLLQTYTATKNDGTKVTGTYVPQTCVLQSKTVSPSTSQQTVSPDSGYDGLSQVTVNAMPSGSATTPATTITANPTISVSASGLITASVSGSKSVTPSVSAGYVSSGTAGTVTVSGSNTQQLTAQAAQTITPTTTDQTIASGKYLTGVQTIKGDANLVAENIKDGVTIFGVTGTYTGGGGSYMVTVSLTNPVNPGEFTGCDIVEQFTSASGDTGSSLGQVISASGSKTVAVGSGLFGVCVIPTGISISVPVNRISCTGGVSYYRANQMGGYIFEVTGDGTITMDGIDYDD